MLDSELTFVLEHEYRFVSVSSVRDDSYKAGPRVSPSRSLPRNARSGTDVNSSILPTPRSGPLLHPSLRSQ